MYIIVKKQRTKSKYNTQITRSIKWHYSYLFPRKLAPQHLLISHRCRGGWAHWSHPLSPRPTSARAAWTCNIIKVCLLQNGKKETMKNITEQTMKKCEHDKNDELCRYFSLPEMIFLNEIKERQSAKSIRLLTKKYSEIIRYSFSDYSWY